MDAFRPVVRKASARETARINTHPAQSRKRELAVGRERRLRRANAMHSNGALRVGGLLGYVCFHEGAKFTPVRDDSQRSSSARVTERAPSAVRQRPRSECWR